MTITSVMFFTPLSVCRLVGEFFCQQEYVKIKKLGEERTFSNLVWIQEKEQKSAGVRNLVWLDLIGGDCWD